jgi:hypothetical protein
MRTNPGSGGPRDRRSKPVGRTNLPAGCRATVSLDLRPTRRDRSTSLTQFQSVSQSCALPLSLPTSVYAHSGEKGIAPVRAQTGKSYDHDHAAANLPAADVG